MTSTFNIFGTSQTYPDCLFMVLSTKKK